jgi:hypothetical protein
MMSASRSSEFPERAGAGTAVKPKVVPHSTRAERAARGKAARGEVPRSAQAQIEFPETRDPLALLEEQAETRVPELVPIRDGRMLVSPFAFFRGGALIMAADLARTPSSGLRVQLCGDAHLSNFSVFGSPERNLVFDINDFDETAPGPWEWDVKRLAASFAVAGRENGFSAEERRAVVLDTRVASLRVGNDQSSGASGGPTLTCPWARKRSSSSSGDGRGVWPGGNVGFIAGTAPSRTIRSSPAGVLSTSTRAPSLSTRKVCATPIGTTAAPPGISSNRCRPA